FGLLRLQALLEQRFGLRLREATRDVPIYVLTPLEGGSRMRSSAGTCVAFTGAPPPPQSPGGAPAEACGVRGGIGRATGRGVDFPRIARWLSGQPDIGRMVYDQSGRTERYDFDIEWTPGGLRAEEPGADAGATLPSMGPGLIAAVERQLGLRLEPTRGPVDVLIVERVARPTPN
ncbi:MAG: TIGR03435 family protein, partial [Vicinamibacterales bacterium]